VVHAQAVEEHGKVEVGEGDEGDGAKAAAPRGHGHGRVEREERETDDGQRRGRPCSSLVAVLGRRLDQGLPLLQQCFRHGRLLLL